MRRYPKIFLGTCLLGLIIGGVAVKMWPQDQAATFRDGAQIFRFQDSGFSDLREFIEGSVDDAKASYKDSADEGASAYTQIGITSHHLPTAASLISKFYVTLLNSAGPRDVFVILGPDHREQGYTSISTTNLPFTTPFGGLELESNIINELLGAGITIDNQSLNGEHSIGVQTVFIKLLFPDAKIVPIIFKSSVEEDKIKSVAEVLSRHGDKVTIVASVDFSHYQPYEYAQMLDNESVEMLKNFRSDSFTLEYNDSPAALTLTLKLAELLEHRRAHVLGLANSYDFTGKSDNTTGYINAIFVPGSEPKILMFVGDIMLSRNVGEKMKRENDWRWPFLEIADYLNEADLLFGNLEGPITGKIINRGNMVFGAEPRTVEGLRYAGFDILSLANNHIGDQGRGGVEDTIRILKENRLDYVGAGYSENEARFPFIKELDGTKLAFLAYVEGSFTPISYKATQTTPGTVFMDVITMQQDVELAKQKADLVIVSMHSGVEYAPRPSLRQIEFSHAAINAGADLVIGHHPHVTQEIEKYKDGYIAYSLGNFLFDQTLSPETMHGLLLKAVLEEDRIREIEPIEIEISHSYQPFLVNKNNAPLLLFNASSF